MKAYKAARSPKGSESDGNANAGDAAISSALKQATSVPLGVAEKVVEVAKIAATLQPITSPNMKSDLTTAIALAKAALEGALANVEINLDSLKKDAPKDEPFVNETRQRSAALRG
jgi:glutamate formiminotransferase/formiminotetrahydrofolate cyclodeaminase